MRPFYLLRTFSAKFFSERPFSEKSFYPHTQESCCDANSCFKDGIEYKDGSFVPLADGCNDCDCINGKASMRTELPCPPSLEKLGYSEKATKFEKIFHLKFDVTEQCQILSGRFFQILWPSQIIRDLFTEMQIKGQNICIDNKTVRAKTCDLCRTIRVSSKFKILFEKKFLLVASMGYLSLKILTEFFFQNSKIFMSKMGRG